MDADVIIVGAGPAGSTAARLLALSKVRVLLIDQAEFPRHKVCAGGLLEHSFREFPEVQPMINCYNHAVRVTSPNLETYFEVESEQPLMAMTSGRTDFDAQLLNLAKKAGSLIKLGEKVLNIESNTEKVTVYTASGASYSSELLIGADSAYSIVARSLKLGYNIRDPYEMGLAMEQEFPLTEKLMDEYFTSKRKVALYLHFGRLCGYAWVFPRKASVNIGLGGSIAQGRILRSQFTQLIDFLIQKNQIPQTLKPDQPMAALLPMTYPTQNCIGNRTMLIGDAGGFCSSATGEGIYYAMKSGKLAAEICQQLLQQKTYSTQAMQSFHHRWQLDLGNELKFQYMAKNYVLMNERRCRAAVNWASQDQALKHIFTDFLIGRQDYAHLKPKMMFHYLRCKALEKLHRFNKPQQDKEYEVSLKEWNPKPF